MFPEGFRAIVQSEIAPGGAIMRHPIDRFTLPICFAVAVFLSSSAGAEMHWVTTYPLPYTAGLALMLGDLVAVGDQAAAVHSRPEAQRLGLWFSRYDSDLNPLVERSIVPEVVNHYEPSLCWDGRTFAVVSSTYNQGTFMILNPAGDYVLPPMTLPGLPMGVGGRTAAFRVRWTGAAYAVFGLWGEPENPGSAYFYTHLVYWLLDGAGQVLASKDLGIIQPLTYPGSEGFDKRYFDVAWTGAAFFVAYEAESETGPPQSVYYRMYDLNGNIVRAEAPVFAGTVAGGPVIACSGRTIGVTALKSVFLEGNHLYVRFFDLAGAPRGPEIEYGSLLGVGPTLSWTGREFLAAYAVSDPYNPSGVVWNVKLNPFDEAGKRSGAEYILKNPQGKTLNGTMSLAVDLHLAGRGRVLFGKAQASDAYMITEWPMVFLMENSRAADYGDLFGNAPRWRNPADPVYPEDLLELMDWRRR